MGILKFYYDKIIFEEFENSEERTYLLEEWTPELRPIEELAFYGNVVKKIMDQYQRLYETDLKEQIWKVIRSLRRIYTQNDDILKQMEVLKEINSTLPAQRSPEWYKFRENLITASSWGNVLGYIDSERKLLLQKLGHEGSQFKGNIFTQFGTKYEPVATSIYERRTKKEVIEFGCMRHPKEENFFLGASPDGIAADGIMLEIKCPPKRPIGNIPTDYYWAQMQGQLEVCDLERCDFLECKIEEYESAEDYEADIGEDQTLSEGQESGVVLQFKRGDEYKYLYSTFFFRGEELHNWMIQSVKDYKGWEFIPFYWKIKKYQCQPVFRDREWFAWAREKLKLFYDKWQFYKIHGYESLLSEKQIKPKRSYSEGTMLTDYDGFTVNEVDDLTEDIKSFGFKEDVSTKPKPIIHSDSESSEKELELKPKTFGFKVDEPPKVKKEMCGFLFK